MRYVVPLLNGLLSRRRALYTSGGRSLSRLGCFTRVPLPPSPPAMGLYKTKEIDIQDAL